ncbi:bacterio-opsin activator domain-containing protein [Natronococcus occultus]|uniref:PAS domain S-box n=1 Tax=Natronococcus occultus SP4 TaxID=694430 RepID=L0K2B3_9EURY|nr:bacterio-opsin activator domain-containing protein [Natronococcus occultus]AGB39146.1 PAS domain S-box [Natronococcus occultus SP4]
MSHETSAAADTLVRVLVVGDDDAVASVAGAVTQGLDSVSLIRERRLPGALARLETVTPHCVVCAFDRGEGGTAIERLRRECESIPILAVADDAVGALEAGATDVVDPADSDPLVIARLERLATDVPEQSSTAISGSLLEGSAAVVWLLGVDGEVAYASPATDGEFGVPPDAIEDRPIEQFVHPDDREAVDETVSAVADRPFGATDRVQVRIGRGDGAWRVVELRISNRLADPNLGGIVVTLFPAIAREPEPDAERVLDRLDEPVFELGDRLELRYANESATELFDRDPEPGITVGSLLPEPIREPVIEELRDHRANEDALEEPTTFVVRSPARERPLGVRVVPSESGAIVQLRALDRTSPSSSGPTAAERTAASVVDALPDGVVVLEDGAVELANAAAVELADDDPLVGRVPAELFDPELAATVRERSRSAPYRWLEPASGRLAVADDRPVDVFVVPLPEDDRTLCVIRDRRRSPAGALATLADAVGAIREVDSESAVRETVAEAALELSGGDVVGLYRSEERALEPIAVATRGSGTASLSAVERAAVPDAVLPDGAGEDADATVHDADALEPFLDETGIRADQVLTVPVGTATLVAATREPMAFDSVDPGPIDVLAGIGAVALEERAAVAELRGCRTDRSSLEATLERRGRLDGIERDLLEASDRETVYRRLCRGTASLSFEDEPIALAWVGTDTSGEDVERRAIAGTEAGDDRLESLADRYVSATAETFSEAEAASVDDPAEDADDSWREHAFEAGIRSVLRVPLRHEGFRYGALVLCSRTPGAFDESTRSGIERLGRVAGAAIDAIETRRALGDDAVTELEFVLREADPLATVAHRVDRPLALRSVVPTEDGGTVFATIPGEDVLENGPDPTRGLGEDVDGLADVRAVGTVGEERLLEFALAGPSIATTVAAHGGVPRSLTPTDDRTRLVLELAGPGDVRAFVDALEREWDLELLARRQRERSPEDALALDATLRERLSERQRQTLEAAYYAGFFEWPRERTGEEIADSLGVSQPTFSRHVRLAQGTVLAVLFEEFGGLE